MIIKLKSFSGAALVALFLVSSQSNAAQLLEHKTSKTKVAEVSGFIPKISSPVTSNFFVPPHLAELQHELDSCESIPQTMRNISRYITRSDVNGDGIDDFIIDFGKIPCLQDTSCGSGGCHHEIWASRNGAWHKVFDAVVQDLKINRGLVQAATHGSACNQPGYKPCLFRWCGTAINL